MAHMSWFTFIAVLATLARCSTSCVDLMGHSHEVTDNATQWDYAFLGTDWVGHDASGNPWTCIGGTFQSPIDLPRSAPPAPCGIKPRFYVNRQPPLNKSIADVWNNGHTIQVQNFNGGNLTGVAIPTLKVGGSITDLVSKKFASRQDLSKVKWVYVPALQFHFHTASEHQMDGLHANLELHVVHRSAPDAFPGCPATGCLAVVGMHIKVRGNKDNAALAPILNAAPFQELGSTPLPLGVGLDFNKIYPTKRSVMAYQGSLTTPPCSSGLLWMVFTEPIYISHRQYIKYRNAIGAKQCVKVAGAAPNCTLAAWDENYRIVQSSVGRTIVMA